MEPLADRHLWGRIKQEGATTIFEVSHGGYEGHKLEVPSDILVTNPQSTRALARICVDDSGFPAGPIVELSSENTEDLGEFIKALAREAGAKVVEF